MTAYHFMGHPKVSTRRSSVKLPGVLTAENSEQRRLEAEKTFLYVYGDNDRRDDALRTKEGLSEKYGVEFG